MGSKPIRGTSKQMALRRRGGLDFFARRRQVQVFENRINPVCPLTLNSYLQSTSRPMITGHRWPVSRRGKPGIGDGIVSSNMGMCRRIWNRGNVPRPVAPIMSSAVHHLQPTAYSALSQCQRLTEMLRCPAIPEMFDHRFAHLWVAPPPGYTLDRRYILRLRSLANAHRTAIWEVLYQPV